MLVREKTVEEVYDQFSASGEYIIKDIEPDVVKKMLDTAVEDADYIDFLLRQKTINWRVIYTLYYGVLRKLCEALIRLDGIKVSNHRGCFAYICVKFPELELDWNFFEKIRSTRNRSKYEDKDLSQRDWRDIEIQIKLYFSTLRKELEEKLK